MRMNVDVQLSVEYRTSVHGMRRVPVIEYIISQLTATSAWRPKERKSAEVNVSLSVSL